VKATDYCKKRKRFLWDGRTGENCLAENCLRESNTQLANTAEKRGKNSTTALNPRVVKVKQDT